MRSSLQSLLAGSALWASAGAVTLFAADSGGNVTTLSLTGCTNNYTLSITSKTTDCEVNPSWLTLDGPNRVLYCYDRGAGSSVSGSLNSFSIGEDGLLSRIARVSAPLSGVAGEILTTSTGARGYISASYNRSAAAVFALGDDGALPGTGPVQVINPTLEKTGPVTLRQDRSYLHHVIIDPTNEYVLIPDLGGDRVRVYTYDPVTVAPIAEVAGLTAPPGSGPRHGFFRKARNGKTFFFFNGELDQKVYSYSVEYTAAGLVFTHVFDAPAIDAALPATRAPTSEIALSPDGRFLTVSNREKSFRDSPILGSGPSDTLSTFSIKEDGTLKLVQLAPSGGWSPRQFSFNKAGTLVAVGHQNNRTVTIWKRDVRSGKIVLEEDGGKVGEVVLTGAVVATIWDE
ncbi:6-phosphogluconolactonase like protein [Verticillium longisporum]|nr:6-phosphogluconolactonase like protein [Verticillium longisporum]KAG7141172.1 6-phosphogluconolactonase like protein [Verticillium longisporum]